MEMRNLPRRNGVRPVHEARMRLGAPSDFVRVPVEATSGQSDPETPGPRSGEQLFSRLDEQPSPAGLQH